MDLQRIRDVKQRVRQLPPAPGSFHEVAVNAANALGLGVGVPRVAIGVGFTNTPKEYRLAIRARSQRDLDRLQNDARFKEIVKDLSEDERDFRVIGDVGFPSILASSPPALGAPAITSHLRSGVSVGHPLGDPGTLGFFAVLNGKRGFVSCNHVIANVDQAKLGDEILQPAKTDGGTTPGLGRLAKIPKLKSGGKKTADCAFAAFENQAQAVENQLGTDGPLNPNPVIPHQFLDVIKVGRKTHRTTGEVRTAEIDDFPATYFGKSVLFDNVIEIFSKEMNTTTGMFEPFCDGGDSGALVYTTSLQPVGLLFRKTNIGGHNNEGIAYANPIGDVLTTLGTPQHPAQILV